MFLFFRVCSQVIAMFVGLFPVGGEVGVNFADGNVPFFEAVLLRLIGGAGGGSVRDRIFYFLFEEGDIKVDDFLFAFFFGTTFS